MDKRLEPLTPLIKEWINQTTGWFTYKDLDKDLDIESSEGKTLRRVVLKSLCDAGIVIRAPKQNGVFRLVQEEAPLIPWQTADATKIVALKFPFGLEEWASIYPKNIIVLAGSFNAGKTAFCLDFIRLNQHRVELADLLPIEYFSSEMGAEEMKLRLSKFSDSDWAFNARERSTNFADVVKPDKINIIDYLEVTTDFYLVAEEISAIFNKLHKGIALITVQKKRGAELGRGAEFSAEKPRLYLSIDSGLLTIVKAKNWAREGENPNGKKFSFSLLSGCKFTNIQEV